MDHSIRSYWYWDTKYKNGTEGWRHQWRWSNLTASNVAIISKITHARLHWCCISNYWRPSVQYQNGTKWLLQQWAQLNLTIICHIVDILVKIVDAKFFGNRTFFEGLLSELQFKTGTKWWRHQWALSNLTMSSYSYHILVSPCQVSFKTGNLIMSFWYWRHRWAWSNLTMSYCTYHT